MLSIQAVRGLPRLRAPGIVPSIISFSTQLPGFFSHTFLKHFSNSFSDISILVVVLADPLRFCYSFDRF